MHRLQIQPAGPRCAAAVAILAACALLLAGCSSTPESAIEDVGPGPRSVAPSTLDEPPEKAPPSGAAPPATDQALIICWDGVQRNHLWESLNRGDLPNLRGLIDKGGFADTIITDHHTETIAGHVQIFTGYGPDITGVFGPKRFAPVPRELSLFARLNQYFGRDRIFQLWCTSKDRRMSSLPDQVWQFARSDVDVWDGDIRRAMTISGPRMLQYMDRYMRPNARFLCFFHFTEPDPIGHSSGENSPKYDAALVGLDQWLGAALDKLVDLGVRDSTAVFVLTDHGWVEDSRTHANAPDAWMATDWAPLVNGDQKDIAPTILTLFGVNLNAIDPPLPGYPLWVIGSGLRASRPAG